MKFLDRAERCVQQGGIQQAEGVVAGRPEDLAARNIAEGGGDAAMHEHLSRIQRLRK